MANQKTVGLLVEDNYEELECHYPYLRLQEEGITPLILGKEKKSYKSKLGYEIHVDVAIENVGDETFDLIIVPGGYAPDKMRTYPPLLTLVQSNYEKGALIAAICHAPWVLISANIIKGKKVTCFPAIKDDVINAGGLYVDEVVVFDQRLITSRKPSDLPFFCKEILKQLLG